MWVANVLVNISANNLTRYSIISIFLINRQKNILQGENVFYNFKDRTDPKTQEKILNEYDSILSEALILITFNFTL